MLRMKQVGKCYKQSGKPFWALREVDLEMCGGETVGIMGQNGSGKSTLLKLLSRITEPTEGSIELEGRVGALLEVGTGFHPELTGHENIYLSGAVLGMSKREVKRHYHEIIGFSGVESFLNTPVKRYSSGMFLRLAFSVMVHLRAEILIVDEILAVGDSEFQQRCFEKMTQVAKEGRAVIFVSHDSQKIEKLCSRIFHMHEGSLHECQAALQ